MSSVTAGKAAIADDLFKIESAIPLLKAPSTTVDEKTVNFYFFDRNHPSEAILLTDDNWDLIDTKKPMVYIIHGWTESRKKQWYADMTAQYLTNGDRQIIQVDWSEPASKGYPEAAQNTRGVGKIIARHIIKTKIPLSLIHIVGHSLGGQTAGFAGKEIQSLTNGNKVQRITALDAAGPLFVGSPESQHLSKNDAVFVDSVHTDAGILGYPLENGHADFYPNGGTSTQPGCLDVGPITSIEDIKKYGSARK